METSMQGDPKTLSTGTTTNRSLETKLLYCELGSNVPIGGHSNIYKDTALCGTPYVPQAASAPPKIRSSSGSVRCRYRQAL